MRPSVRLAWTSAIFISTILPFAARAADPTPVKSAATNPARNPNGSDLNISPNPAVDTPGEANVTDLPLPISAPPVTGLFPSAGRTLLDRGIDIHGIILDHFLANPSAGPQPGNTANVGIFAPAVDFDFGKLAGLSGGSVHLQALVFLFRSNEPNIVPELGGILAGYQGTPIRQTSALSYLTYEQKLFDDKLSIEVGRTNIHRYFLIPNGIDPFTYDPRTFYADGDVNGFPYGLWGGRVNYHLTPNWYVQAGAFEDDYPRAVTNDYNLGIHGAAGAQVLGEIAYRSEFNTAPYPANMELGLEWNTRHGFSNLKGVSADYRPGRQATNYPGGGVIFFQGAKVLWRGAAPANGPPKNIQVYGFLDASVDKPQPIDMDAMVGVNFTGFLPGRSFDTLGLQAHYLRLSQIEDNFESALQRRVAGPGPMQPRDGFGFEVVDRVQLTPWASLTPFVQYFVSQDSYATAPQKRPRDGVIAGFFTTISLGPALGTSRKPF